MLVKLVQVFDIGAAVYSSVHLPGCSLGHLVVICLCKVIVVVILLKLVVLDVIVGAPLKSVFAISLVKHLHNDLFALVDHDLVGWVLLLDDIDEILVRLCSQVSLPSEIPQLGSCS